MFGRLFLLAAAVALCAAELPIPVLQPAVPLPLNPARAEALARAEAFWNPPPKTITPFSFVEPASANAPAGPSRRAIPYPYKLNNGSGISTENGGHWPPLTKREVVGTVQRVVRSGDAIYTANFVRNSNTNIQFFNNHSRYMTRKVSTKLDTLAGLVPLVFGASMKLGVHYGWPNPQLGDEPDTPLDLEYEGREVGLTLYYVSGTYANTYTNSLDALKVLAELAWEAGFSFMAMDRTLVPPLLESSSFGDFCPSRVDAAFLFDGTYSVKAAGFAQQKLFVRNATASLRLGPDASRVAVGTFGGPTGYQFSTLPGVPDCPPGSEFEGHGLGCMCVVGGRCLGPTLSPDNPTRGCGAGFFLTGPGVCPDTTNTTQLQLYNTNRALFPNCVMRPYFTHSCTNGACLCDPVTTPWVPEASAYLYARFNETRNATALASLIDAMPYPNATNTHMSIGLYRMRTEVFSLNGGMRPVDQGIPRVLITLTDGVASQGFDPTVEIGHLHDKGVRTYAVGLNPATDYYPTLQALASVPTDRHIYKVDSATDLGHFLDEISFDICSAPVSTPIGQLVNVSNFASLQINYYSFECSVPTQRVVLEVTEANNSATGTNIFISTTDPSPTRFSYDGAATSAAHFKSAAMTKVAATDAFFGAVESVVATTGAFVAVAWAGVFAADTLAANALPPTTPGSSTSVINASVVMAAIDNVPAGGSWQYWLDTVGNEAGQFTIDATTGVITVTASDADREANPVRTLRRFARHSTTSCLVGLQTVTVYLRPQITNGGAVVTADETTGSRNNNHVVRRAAPACTNGATIFTVTAVDAPFTAPVTYVFADPSGNLGNAFALNAQTGAVTVADCSQLDYENPLFPVGGPHTFVLRVRASGASGLSAVATFSYALTNVNEPPYFTAANIVADTLPAMVRSYNASMFVPVITLPFRSDNLDYTPQKAQCSLSGAVAAQFTVARIDNSCVVSAGFAQQPAFDAGSLVISVTEGGAGDSVTLPLTIACPAGLGGAQCNVPVTGSTTTSTTTTAPSTASTASTSGTTTLPAIYASCGFALNNYTCYFGAHCDIPVVCTRDIAGQRCPPVNREQMEAYENGRRSQAYQALTTRNKRISDVKFYCYQGNDFDTSLIDGAPAATKSSGGSNAGAVAGAIIGVLVLLALIALVVFLLMRRRRQREEEADAAAAAAAASALPGAAAFNVNNPLFGNLGKEAALAALDNPMYNFSGVARNPGENFYDDVKNKGASFDNPFYALGDQPAPRGGAAGMAAGLGNPMYHPGDEASYGLLGANGAVYNVPFEGGIGGAANPMYAAEAGAADADAGMYATGVLQGGRYSMKKNGAASTKGKKSLASSGVSNPSYLEADAPPRPAKGVSNDGYLAAATPGVDNPNYFEAAPPRPAKGASNDGYLATATPGVDNPNYFEAAPARPAKGASNDGYRGFGGSSASNDGYRGVGGSSVSNDGYRGVGGAPATNDGYFEAADSKAPPRPPRTGSLNHGEYLTASAADNGDASYLAVANPPSKHDSYMVVNTQRAPATGDSYMTVKTPGASADTYFTVRLEDNMGSSTDDQDAYYHTA